MGRKKRLYKKLHGLWNGYVDFSQLQIDGYLYVKSVYKEDLASSLITKEHIQVINQLRPIFKEKERTYYKVLRFSIDGRIKENSFENSFLYRIYCNGFTSGYKDVDKKIRSYIHNFIVLSADDCNKAIRMYIRELDSMDDCPNKNTKNWFDFIDFLVDIGKREGATVRGLVYEKELAGVDIKVKLPEKNKRGRKKKDQTLSEILFETVAEKPENIINLIEERLKSKCTELDIAYVKIALEEMHYINKCSAKLFRDALAKQFEEKIEIIGERGVQKSYKRLTEVLKGTNKALKDIGKDREEIDIIKETLSF